MRPQWSEGLLTIRMEAGFSTRLRFEFRADEWARYEEGESDEGRSLADLPGRSDDAFPRIPAALSDEDLSGSPESSPGRRAGLPSRRAVPPGTSLLARRGTIHLRPGGL